jgi:hypothetical protein
MTATYKEAWQRGNPNLRKREKKTKNKSKQFG